MKTIVSKWTKDGAVEMVKIVNRRHVGVHGLSDQANPEWVRLDDIPDHVSLKTAVWEDSQLYGEDVHRYRTNGDLYLRTDPNKTPEDNLGNVSEEAPPFSERAGVILSQQFEGMIQDKL